MNVYSEYGLQEARLEIERLKNLPKAPHCERQIKSIENDIERTLVDSEMAKVARVDIANAVCDALISVKECLK